jgi:hypothetical protein
MNAMSANYKQSRLYKKYRAFRIALKVPGILLRQRLVDFDVPSLPHFDSDETTQWFMEKLAASKMYLEFGSGGSTCLAAKKGIKFVSVDSDPFFLNSVKNKIKKENLYREDDQVFHHADVGLTGGWGKPLIIGEPSPERLNKFRKYSDFPSEIGNKFPLPDLVLVDGRFRVACALKTLKALQDQKGWLLLVDDYVNRSKYHELPEFGVLQGYVGRMAVFSGLQGGAKDRLDAAIRRYETDPS